MPLGYVYKEKIMRILIIRHGDPDYEIDGLTKKGKIEAEFLADHLEKEEVSNIYCSTLGRARLTAEPTAKRLGLDVNHCEWLREFNYEKVKLPYFDKPKIVWDLFPEFVNTHPELYSPTWYNADFIKESGIKAAYDEVCKQFDNVLKVHGYERDGFNYKAVRPNHDTIAIVCHFGLTAVLLSHILNCSPVSVWQHTVTLTTSVTTLYTEERAEGNALIRMCGMSDVYHLRSQNHEPSFSGRFCECFTDDTRH